MAGSDSLNWEHEIEGGMYRKFVVEWGLAAHAVLWASLAFSWFSGRNIVTHELVAGALVSSGIAVFVAFWDYLPEPEHTLPTPIRALIGVIAVYRMFALGLCVAIACWGAATQVLRVNEYDDSLVFWLSLAASASGMILGAGLLRFREASS